MYGNYRRHIQEHHLGTRLAACVIKEKKVGDKIETVDNSLGMTLPGHLFLKRKGTFPRNKKGTSLFIARFLGHVPPVSPGS